RLAWIKRVLGTIPERSIENSRMIRLSLHVVDSGFLILIQNLLPVLAAVGCLVNPALRAGPATPSSRHQNNVGIPRIDHDPGDDVGFAQADIRPGRSSIR